MATRRSKNRPSLYSVLVWKGVEFSSAKSKYNVGHSHYRRILENCRGRIHQTPKHNITIDRHVFLITKQLRGKTVTLSLKI